MVAARQDWKCPGIHCLGNVSLPSTWEVDHVVPLFQGGSNEVTNLQVLCPLCHRIKSQQERVQFYYQERLKRCEKSVSVLAPKLSRKFLTPKAYYDSCHARWIVLYNDHGRVKRVYFSDAKYGVDAKHYADICLESLRNSDMPLATLSTS